MRAVRVLLAPGLAILAGAPPVFADFPYSLAATRATTRAFT
jgi:hypothetical protein